MDTENYKVLLEEIRGTREEVGRIDRDLAKDRQDIGDFKVRLAGVEAEIKEMRIAIISQANKVKDKVSDAVEPMEKQIAGLTQTIKKKKTLVLIEKIGILRQIKGWWSTIIRG